ncbi:MAG TPA: hypothetical protein VEA69_04330 [Tepidisphaeraceae bacterium]|nr:hypothetical protein [Tepidisphaeraceae bacterium]
MEVHWLTASTYLKGFCVPLAIIALTTAILVRGIRKKKDALAVVLGALAWIICVVAPVCFILVPSKDLDRELIVGAHYGSIVAGVGAISLVCTEAVRAWRRSRPIPRGFAVVRLEPTRDDEAPQPAHQVN